MLVSETKPSVLHVITTIARGGAENHLVDLISGQVQAGWTVSVAFLKSDGDRYWQGPLEAMGVHTIDLGLERYGQVAPIGRLRRLVEKISPAIIHAHMPPAELYTRLALLGLPRTPLIISKHCDIAFMRGPLDSLSERWCAARASRIIAISGAVSRYFEARWPERLRSRIQTIHYGLDASPYEAVSGDEVSGLRRQWEVGPADFLVGTVARLTGQKALDVMIRGFAMAVEAEPDRVTRLVLVGRGEDEAALKGLCESLGISSRVVFAGFRTDIPAVMKSLDVFALTSDFEGFGLVLLEAMSAGKPIIATNVSAIPEVVADGETGILVPAQDPRAFGEAVIRLLDPALRDRLGQAGRRRVSEVFSPTVMVQATLDAYRKALGR